MLSYLAIFSYSPWWLYPLFGFIFFKAIGSLKDRIVSWPMLYLFPVFFITMGIHAFLKVQPITLEHVINYAGSFALGLATGWLVTRHSKGHTKSRGHKIHIPGSIFPVCISIIMFCTQFSYNALHHLKPEMALGFFGLKMMVIGFLPGISWGRSLTATFMLLKNNVKKT